MVLNKDDEDNDDDIDDDIDDDDISGNGQRDPTTNVIR